MKQKPLKSRWYRANWFTPAHKIETPEMRDRYTEPMTLSHDGKTQYHRENGIWKATKEPTDGTEQQHASANALQKAHDANPLRSPQ